MRIEQPRGSQNVVGPSLSLSLSLSLNFRRLLGRRAIESTTPYHVSLTPLTAAAIMSGDSSTLTILRHLALISAVGTSSPHPTSRKRSPTSCGCGRVNRGKGREGKGREGKGREGKEREREV